MGTNPHFWHPLRNLWKTAQPPLVGGGDRRASPGCSGVQGQNPGQERSVNAGPDPSRPSSGQGCLCLPLQGADHKESGASKERRRGMNGNGGCRALRVSTGRFWESQPAAVEGSARGASGSTLTEDQQHVPGARPVHTTETHGNQQHPADLPRASHGGGSGLASVPRSREHQSRPAPPSVMCTPGPPRTRPRSRSHSPSLSGFCRLAAETTGDPELRRRRETRSCGVR